MQFDFNLAGVEPAQNNFELLPPGDYAVMVVETNLKPHKEGQMLETVCQIIEGDHVNRKLWWNHVVTHSDPEKEPGCKARFRGFVENLGVNPDTLSESQTLHGIPFIANVRVKPAKDGYNARNEIGYSKAMQRGNATAPVMGAPQTAAASAPPWG